MSSLLASMNKINESFRKAGSFDSDIGMFSGFTPIDILSTNVEYAQDLDVELLNGGMFSNPYTEIGLSAVGKTSLWIQVLGGCVDNWYRYYGPVSELLFYNAEMHTSAARVKDLTGWDDEQMQEKLHMVSAPWSIIEIYNEIAKFARTKLEHKKELEVDTGIRNIIGQTIKCLPTTYVLIDSIAAIRKKTELEFDKNGEVKSTDSVAGSNNMDAMSIANDNTKFINEVKKLCADAKICVVMINHLVEVPVLDRYNPPKPQLPGMKFNQKVKGGNELLYQSYCVGQLSIRERMFQEKQQVYGPNVHGIVALMDWLKNKNGPEGVRYPMVFDSATGYKPELTDFELLYSEGGYGIEGNPMNYHLAILPEISFTKKTLLDKCHENPILARALSFTARLYLVSKIVNRETPPDLTGIGEVPFEYRIDMILQHSIDYPGYINHGWIVPDEYFDMSDEVSRILDRREGYNVNIPKDELEWFAATGGELADTQRSFDCYTDNIVKIGETEFALSASDDSKWK